jgi:hypothetical protein
MIWRGKDIKIADNIDLRVESFRCAHSIKIFPRENDIDAQINYGNTYRPKEREEKQRLLDRRNITHDFSEVLFEKL